MLTFPLLLKILLRSVEEEGDPADWTAEITELVLFVVTFVERLIFWFSTPLYTGFAFLPSEKEYGQ